MPDPANPRHGLGPLTKIFVALALFSLFPAPVPVAAQSDYYFPPGESFDPGIPSPEEFFGYPMGSFVTRQDRIVAYFRSWPAFPNVRPTSPSG